MKLRSSDRYVQATAAAVSWNLVACVHYVAGLLQYPPRSWWTVFEQNSIANLLAVGIVAFVVRAVHSPVTSGRTGRIVLGDLCGYGLVLLVVGLASVPFDTSGAAILAIIMWTLWGIPLTIGASLLSILAVRKVWMMKLLGALLFVEVIGYLIGFGGSLIAT
ncbi:MAG: hypothetical protein J0H64_07800 [Actinobacteria bacterium]|nr:hypothetical protein [Actinomycetota bacterium]